jgi:DNA-binding transcriptional regulator GbsR (MarR family)
MGVREDFVDQWGALGTCWGINRSMAQIHGRLLLATEPVPADQLQEELGISRGNVSTNLRDLQDWGLIKAVVQRGDRRQFFEAEKDPWRIFCIVARERKRREIEPTLRALQDLEARASDATGPEARAMRKQIAALTKFVAMAGDFLDRIAAREESQVIPTVLKLFK